MKKIFLLTFSALCSCFAISHAQTLLTINGGSMVLEPGAVLFVEGGIENINSGSIDNDGTIELEGDLLIDGTSTFDGTDPNVVRFSGGADSDVTTNGAIFDVIEIDKDATFDVNLLDNLTIAGSLDFISNDNKVNLGANNLIMQAGSAITGADEQDYVVTDGAGYMVREGLAASTSFKFEVGDANSYTPATLAANGGHATDTFSVRVDAEPLDMGLTGSPVGDAVHAVWDIEEMTTGGSDVDVTLEWGLGDEDGDFDRSQSGVSHYDGGWDLLYANTDMADVVVPAQRWSQTRSNVSDFSPYAVGGESLSNALVLDLTVMLQGAMDGGSPAMQDSIRSRDLLDAVTLQPYTALGFVPEGFGGNETVDVSVFDDTGIPADNIVDWIWVEIRDAVTPTTVLATKSALLTRDGSIVDLDGTSNLTIAGLADGNYHIAIRHRNHLEIRTASAQALSDAALAYDFSSGLGQAYDDGVTANDPMFLHAGSGLYAMWTGDGNQDGDVKYNGANNDKNEVLFVVGATTPNNVMSGLYSPADFNMDGDVKYNGANNDKNMVLTVVGLTSPNNIVSAHQ
ncbi:MAG: hypothetical protein R3301_18765 [Saprospiraceae bacterium]|nr:hypothetical protein [Saprospiraceae bacterium]